MQTHIKFLEHQYNQAYKELDFETAEEFYRIKEILIDLNETAGQVEPEVKVNFADIIELLELFIAYGMIYTVGGVTYPNGTHKETIDKANKLLWRLRNETMYKL